MCLKNEIPVLGFVREVFRNSAVSVTEPQQSLSQIRELQGSSTETIMHFKHSDSMKKTSVVSLNIW